MKRTLVTCLGILLIAGCSDFPEVGSDRSAQADAADYPTLLPIDTLLAHGDGAEDSEAEIEILRARAARLRARAAALRGTAIN